MLIESAFRRDLGPGVQVQASLLPHVNPITLAINLIKSIPVGIDNALEELGAGRKLGTTPSGPYGVGGPQLPAPPVTAMTSMPALSASEAAEPDAPQVDSLARDAGTRKSNEAKTVSAPPDTAPAPDPEPKTKPAAAEKKPKPPAKDADQPKVHGPIEYDSQKTPTESPSSTSGGKAADGDTSATETKSTTTPDSTNSPGSETKDAA